jgi:HlyD family secretion protein
MSPDTKQDRPDLPHYFLVRIVLKPGEIERLNGQRLSPGMPAEVFIRTGERTALSYLVKPFTDQLARALTER